MNNPNPVPAKPAIPQQNKRLFLEALPDPRKLIAKLAIKANDTVLEALGKLQGQLNARFYYENLSPQTNIQLAPTTGLEYNVSISDLMKGDYLLTINMLVGGSHSGCDLTFVPMLDGNHLLPDPIVIRAHSGKARIPVTIKKKVSLLPGEHKVTVSMSRENSLMGVASVTSYYGSVELSGLPE